MNSALVTKPTVSFLNAFSSASACVAAPQGRVQHKSLDKQSK